MTFVEGCRVAFVVLLALSPAVLLVVLTHRSRKDKQ